MIDRLNAVILFVLLLALAGCGTETPSLPTAPTPTPTPIAAISISGLPGSLSVGQSVQLTANVTLADGGQKLTSDATWTSSNATVATVSTTGILSLTEFGDANVTATFQSVSGVVRVVVSKPSPSLVTYDISGTVHESAPTENVLLTGATVGIHFVGCPSCPHDNQTTMTDASGHFTLQGIDTAGFTLWLTKPGYEAASYVVAQLPRDQHPDIVLIPELAIVPERYDFIFQRSDCPRYDCIRDISFAVHHQGTIAVQECDGDLPEETDNVGLFRQGTSLAFHVCEALLGGWNWPVEAGFVYTVRTHGVFNSPFHMVFTHPN